MKLKMAPNSLFAVLLRSPWWASFVVAGVMALASRALLPADYWVFGALGGLPIVVIGCIALVRQLRAPDPKKLEAVSQTIAAMSWRDFAAKLAAAYEAEGYSVKRLNGAADFALTRTNSTTLVAAKRWKAALQGEDSVQALQASVGSHQADAGVLISLGELSANARQLAGQHGIRIVGRAELALLLRSQLAPQ